MAPLATRVPPPPVAVRAVSLWELPSYRRQQIAVPFTAVRITSRSSPPVAPNLNANPQTTVAKLDGSAFSWNWFEEPCEQFPENRPPPDTNVSGFVQPSSANSAWLDAVDQPSVSCNVT